MKYYKSVVCCFGAAVYIRAMHMHVDGLRGGVLAALDDYLSVRRKSKRYSQGEMRSLFAM